VFDAMLSGTSLEATSHTIEVNDLRSATFRQLLHYIYKGEVEADHYLCDCDLMYAAEKYQLKGLKSQMEECFVTQVDFDNIADMISIGDMFDLKDLMAVCNEVVRRTQVTTRSSYYDRHEIKITSEFIFKKNLCVMRT
jgi:hypothetical protein